MVPASASHGTMALSIATSYSFVYGNWNKVQNDFFVMCDCCYQHGNHMLLMASSVSPVFVRSTHSQWGPTWLSLMLWCWHWHHFSMMPIALSMVPFYSLALETNTRCEITFWSCLTICTDIINNTILFIGWNQLTQYVIELFGHVMSSGLASCDANSITNATIPFGRWRQFKQGTTWLFSHMMHWYQYPHHVILTASSISQLHF